MTEYDWILRGAAILLGIAVLMRQVQELRHANGTRVTKYALLFFNLIGMGACALAPLVWYGHMTLETGIHINTTAMISLFIQLFIVYFQKR